MNLDHYPTEGLYDELLTPRLKARAGLGRMLETPERLNYKELDTRRRRTGSGPPPRDYIAQPVVNLSTVPTLRGERIEPRHVDLRPFILQGGHSYVTAGGLTRVALARDSLVVNSSQGGGSAYRFVRIGRNLERADMSARIIDVGCVNLLPVEGDTGAAFAELLWLNVLNSLSSYQIYRQHVKVRPSRVERAGYQDQEYVQSGRRWSSFCAPFPPLRYSVKTFHFRFASQWCALSQSL